MEKETNKKSTAGQSSSKKVKKVRRFFSFYYGHLYLVVGRNEIEDRRGIVVATATVDKIGFDSYNWSQKGAGIRHEKVIAKENNR